MLEEQIKAIEARLNAMTPKPGYLSTEAGYFRVVAAKHEFERNAPTDIRALLAEVTRLCFLVAAARAALTEIDQSGAYPEQSVLIGTMLLALRDPER